MTLPQADTPCDDIRLEMIAWAESAARLACRLAALYEDQPPPVTSARHLHAVPQPLQFRQQQLPRPPAWRRLHVGHHAAATILIAIAVFASGILTGWLG